MSINVRGGKVNSGALGDLQDVYHNVLKSDSSTFNNIREHAAQKAGFMPGQYAKGINVKETAEGPAKRMFNTIAHLPKVTHLARTIERSGPGEQKMMIDNFKKYLPQMKEKVSIDSIQNKLKSFESRANKGPGHSSNVPR